MSTVSLFLLLLYLKSCRECSCSGSITLVVCSDSRTDVFSVRVHNVLVHFKSTNVLKRILAECNNETDTDRLIFMAV